MEKEFAAHREDFHEFTLEEYLGVPVEFIEIEWDNKVLQWLGKHCFSIYMLQRLPMIIFGKTTLVHHSVVFTALTLACALLLAWAFTAMTDRIDKRVFA